MTINQQEQQLSGGQENSLLSSFECGVGESLVLETMVSVQTSIGQQQYLQQPPHPEQEQGSHQPEHVQAHQLQHLDKNHTDLNQLKKQHDDQQHQGDQKVSYSAYSKSSPLENQHEHVQFEKKTAEELMLQPGHLVKQQAQDQPHKEHQDAELPVHKLCQQGEGLRSLTVSRSILGAALLNSIQQQETALQEDQESFRYQQNSFQQQNSSSLKNRNKEMGQKSEPTNLQDDPQDHEQFVLPDELVNEPSKQQDTDDAEQIADEQELSSYFLPDQLHREPTLVSRPKVRYFKKDEITFAETYKCLTSKPKDLHKRNRSLILVISG